MIGGWNVGNGGGGSFVITFNTTPMNATITVRDEKGAIIQPSTEKTYKLKAGIYNYDVTADGYFSKTNQSLYVLEDATETVVLDKKLYVTFVLTPTNATLEVKDGSGIVQNPQEDHTYELKAGMYSYSCSAEGYKSVENVSFEMKDSEEEKTINVQLLDASIYGVRRQLSISSTAWERINNGAGKTANAQTSASPVQNDFDNIAPWKDIKICDVLKDGTVSSYEGDPTFSATNPKGYIMVEVPDFWWKREQTGGYEYIYISAVEQDGYTKSNKFYIGKYTATGSKSAVTCKSGAANLVSISITDLRTAAKNIGTNWGLMDILRWSLIQMLYLVEYADYNCQKTIGYGVSNGSIINTGGCDSIKNKSGCLSNDQKHAVVYRGIENLWGNIWQWVDGININSYYAWVCYDRSQYASDKVASPYKKLAYKDATSSGYIKTMGYDADNSAIQRATATGGSDSTYCPDYFLSASSTYAVYVGGSCSDGGSCGLWYADCSGSSATGSSLGGRLLFVPV